jgi:hypothetical protein
MPQFYDPGAYAPGTVRQKFPEEQRSEVIKLLQEILTVLKQIEEKQPHRGTAS